MRVLPLLAGVTLLSACGSISTTEPSTGVRASDREEIRAAARAITDSPITDWQLWPNSTRPTQIIFYTEDGKIYSARKTGGKWRIVDITKAVGAQHQRLPRRWTQPKTVGSIGYEA